MPLQQNERTRLLANAIDRVSTTCFAVGVLVPTATLLVHGAPTASLTRSGDPFWPFLVWLLSASAPALEGLAARAGDDGLERPPALSRRFSPWRSRGAGRKIPDRKAPWGLGRRKARPAAARPASVRTHRQRCLAEMRSGPYGAERGDRRP